MAAFDSGSDLQSDAFSSRHPSGSPFNIPSFFIRFSTKISADNDSARSPTSPLDLVFSSFKNPFGFRCQKSSSRAGSERMLHCTKVGLGILNSLANETQVVGEVVNAPEMKNILFRPQVRKANSSNNVGGNGVPVTPEAYKDIVSSWSYSMCAAFSQNPSLGLKDFCSENKAAMSLPTLIGGGSHVKNSLVTKPSSLPVSNGSGHTNVIALSAREIELSEDYTCVICHGPNPKTIHIFGDCILECHTNELYNFAKKEEHHENVLPQVARWPEGTTPSPSNELMSFCYSCKNKSKEGENISIYRGDKPFCSLECRSEKIFAEEETEKSFNNSSVGSPVSSSHEDLFLMGFHAST